MVSARKMAGALLFLASVQWLVLLLVAECLYPGYSVSQNYISDLGVGTTAYLFNSSTVLLGVLILTGAYFIHRSFEARLFVVLLVLTGIGAVGVGLFPEDAGVIHGIAALIAFLFGGLSAIASHKLVNPPLNLFSAGLGGLALVALALFVSGTYLGLGAGGMERMIVYPVLLWGAGLGGYLLSSPA